MKKEDVKSKIYDFTKVLIEDVEGNKDALDLSKIVGNVLYSSTPDIGAMDKAREIYHKGKTELTNHEAAYYLNLIKESPAIVGPFKIGLEGLLKEEPNKK